MLLCQQCRRPVYPSSTPFQNRSQVKQNKNHFGFFACCRSISFCSSSLALRSSSSWAITLAVSLIFHFVLSARKPGRRQLGSDSLISILMSGRLCSSKTRSSVCVNCLHSVKYSCWKGFSFPVLSPNCSSKLGNRKQFSGALPMSGIRSITFSATRESMSLATPGQEQLSSSSSTKTPVMAQAQTQSARAALFLTISNWHLRMMTSTFSPFSGFFLGSFPLMLLLRAATEYSGWLLRAVFTSATKACSLLLPCMVRLARSNLSMLGVAMRSRQARALRPSVTSPLNLRRKVSSVARMMAVQSSASCAFMPIESISELNAQTHNIQISFVFIRIINFLPKVHQKTCSQTQKTAPPPPCSDPSHFSIIWQGPSTLTQASYNNQLHKLQNPL